MPPSLIPDTPDDLRARSIMFQYTESTRKGYRVVIQRAERLDPDGVPRYTLHGEFGPLHAITQCTEKTAFPVPWARVWTLYVAACVERFAHGYYLMVVDTGRGRGGVPRRSIASTAEELGALVARCVRPRSPVAAPTVADIIRRAPPAWRAAVRAEDLGVLCRSDDDLVRLDAIQWLSTATSTTTTPTTPTTPTTLTPGVPATPVPGAPRKRPRP